MSAAAMLALRSAAAMLALSNVSSL